MNTCSYCRREMPHDHTNMEGQPWCGVCTWWSIELRRLRMRLGLLTSEVTPWRMRLHKYSHQWTEADTFINITPETAVKFFEGGRVGLGVDVPSVIAEPTPCG